ncbi:MAG TPA: HAD family hydrolase [Opitutaceae bacterium]|nr:HAD family hydrolase [Opitutaceae bacterium]
MRYRTVLFDLDGTLVDHLPAIHRCYAHTLPQLGLPAPTREQVRRVIGGGLENAMRRFVREADLPRALRIYRAFWDRTMLEGVDLMPGAGELLRALHANGCTLAVLSNKYGSSSRLVCDYLGIAPLFRGIFGAHDTPWLKPDAKFTAHVLATLGADAPSTCLIGDSPFDAEAARTGGLTCFLVTTGTHSRKELEAAGAEHVYPDLPSLAREVFGLRLAAPPTADRSK